MKSFDLAIIGGGPAGYVAAERAGAKGLSVVLFEKRELGGVCLNEGCVPTKTLLYSAKMYDNALSGGKYGVKAEGVTFDYTAIVNRKNKVVRKLVLGVAAKMKEHGVEVVKGEAFVKGRTADGAIEGRTGQNIEIVCATSQPTSEETFSAKNLLICTGSEAFVPPIPGLAEAGDTILTNREILASKERPESLVVIGGGVIGMEFASFFNSLGTKVTVVEMLPEILGQTEPQIGALLRNIYAKKGISFNLSCRVTRIDGNAVFFTDPEGVEHSVEGDKILVSVGRRAVTQGFGLENLGIEAPRGIGVDEKMNALDATGAKVPGVWAAGDVTGRSMLAHTASREAEVAINNITGRPDAMRYDAIPAVVYTNPEVASVGMTLAEAKTAGLDAKELGLPMSYSGRFVAENEGGEGFCRVVVENESGRILGVHLIGGPAGEMIWGAAAAIERGETTRDLERVIFPHPTVSEIVKETVFTF
ncbi:MAG: dihydrolipoyl dehydrogenase [Alistipes sp.]|jgi:dihydrolipoamide dehydrogenase|nr:dihydrolipoyl dehydrogenase [Alistipes sp.]